MLWVVAALILLVVACAAAFAIQALRARDDLRAAADHARDLRAAVTDGDAAAAQQSLAALQDRSAQADAETHNVLWTVAGHLPAWGDDVHAVQTVSAVLHDLAAGGLPPVVDAAADLDLRRLAPNNGRVDLQPLLDVATALGPARAAADSAAARLEDVDAAGLTPALREPFTDLRGRLGDVQDLLAASDTAAHVLPAMLGADGPRRQMVLFQNNAEVRSTGGIPGAFAIMRTDRGRLTLEKQGSAADFGEFADPVLPLTEEEKELYTRVLGEFFQNTTLTPDFPRSAQLAREMWHRVSGQTVDGVISFDPVGLSYMLAGTGPIQLPDGTTLTADNAVDVLLSDTYLRFPDDPQAQNLFFASAAATVFDAVASGQGDPRRVIEGFVRAVEEHRVWAWSSHDAVQQALAPTQVGGRLIGEAPDEPRIGVYLNDVTGAKMDYYLDYDVQAGTPSCDADGTQSLPLTLTFRSTAPADAKKSLPESVVGPGFGIAARGETYVKVDVYAPVGGRVGEVQMDGERAEVRHLAHDGHGVMDTYVLLKPGQQITLDLTVTTAAHQPGDVHVHVTPGVQPENESFTTQTGCA